jgi:hypothetical protein
MEIVPIRSSSAVTSPTPPGDAEPTIASLVPESGSDDRSNHLHRQLIGWFGLALPILLYAGAGTRPTPGLAPWGLLGSISAYYYTGAVVMFVGILVALALRLLTYGGYDNEHRRADRVAAVVAGVAAFLVAFFPTDVPPPVAQPPWWTPAMGYAHSGSAALLFAAFAYFSLVLFTRSDPRTPLTAGKRRRNLFFRISGAGILACSVSALIAGGFLHRGIFWWESGALTCFALSWLVKGRIDMTAGAAGRLAAYHARRLVRARSR